MTRPKAEPSAKHIDAARRRVTHLAGLSAKTDSAERNILAAAGERRVAVQDNIDRLAPRVNLDQDAASDYMAKIQERGRLDQIIGQARQAGAQ